MNGTTFLCKEDSLTSGGDDDSAAAAIIIDLKIALQAYPRSARRFTHLRPSCPAPALLYDRALTCKGKGVRSYP